MIDAAIARIAQACLEAPLNDAPWLHVAHAIGRELGDDLAIVINLAPGWSPGGPAFAVGIDPTSMQSLATTYYRMSPWGTGLSRRYGEGYFGLGFDDLSPSQLRASEFFNGWMRPAGLVGFEVVYGGYPVVRKGVDELLIAAAGKTTRSRPDAAHVELGRRVMPYLKHTFLLLERLMQGAEDAVRANAHEVPWSVRILDRIRLAAFVVTGTAHIHYLNRAAEQLLQHGRVLRQVRGKLEAGIHRDTSALHQLIDLAAFNVAARPGALVLGASDSTRVLQLIASPLPARDVLAGHVLLLISSPQKPDRSSSELLMRSYGLTVGEARLTVRLATLFNLRDAAEAEQLSYETARTYFKRSAAKLGVRSQAAAIERVRALGIIQDL